MEITQLFHKIFEKNLPHLDIIYTNSHKPNLYPIIFFNSTGQNHLLKTLLENKMIMPTKPYQGQAYSGLKRIQKFNETVLTATKTKRNFRKT